MNLQTLSNVELESNLKKLVVSERKILHLVLEHILEVDSRKLYLERAYSSLYDYLIKECGYSGSAAMRRISAARLMREIPAMVGQIQNGGLNLSQVSELSRAIKEKEKTGIIVSISKKSELVAAITGKTTGETQRQISKALDIELKTPEAVFMQKDDSVHLQLTLTAKQYAKLMQCRDRAASVLLSENGDVSMAAIIDLLANSFLKQKNVGMAENDLGQKAQANSKVTSKENSAEYKGHTSEDIEFAISPAVTVPALAVVKANKTLTPKTRRQIILRDRCCQFKDPQTGKACESTFNLEIDHIQPRWAQGNHSDKNLQVLCRAHNNFKYYKETNLRVLGS